MREIKFRGKRIDSGEWVYGYFTKNKTNGNCYITTQSLAGGAHPHRVDPETVGEFTGPLGKNGAEIYEGDIINVCTFGFEPDVFTTKVIYKDAAFRLENGRNMFYFGQKDFTKMDDATVIGNIYENPELREGAVE